MSNSFVEILSFLEASIKDELSCLEITRITLNDSKTICKMYISGADKLDASNSLATAFVKAEESFGCEVDFVFEDLGNSASAMDIIGELIANEILRKTDINMYNLAIYSRLSVVDDCLNIVSDSINENDSSLINEYIDWVMKLFYMHTGISLSNTSVKFEDISTSLYRIPGDENRCMNVIPVNLVTAEELANEEVKIRTSKSSKSSGGSNSRSSARSSGDISSTSKSSSEELTIDKNSWVYKAEEQKKANKENGLNKDFVIRGNADALFGRVKKGVSHFAIKDISYSESEINLEGILRIKDDLKVTKSGKSVVCNFTIIDKTGGIGGFAFLKPEEADAFEKMFSKGAYAGYQGEVTNNRGEIGIKLTGVFEKSPPPKRKDNCDYKRVELHAHTKMSESDAVIVPAELMKTAASFGHKACAVTDHGVVQAFPEVYSTSLKLKVGSGDEPFKPILGVEGYVVDDGPTICYNLPFERSERTTIGYLCSVAIRTTGEDSCENVMDELCIRKYHLKNYIHVKPVEEGESEAQAREFSDKDIDKSLWNEGEFEDFANAAASPRGYIKEDYDEKYWSSITYAPDISSMSLGFAADDQEIIPENTAYEFVAEYKTRFTKEVWKGPGNEPVDSYFKMGEVIEFIGDSYLCGRDIFKALDFMRKAGYAINIEEHQYYRHKFLQPVISIYDICKCARENDSDNSYDLNKEYDDLSSECSDIADMVIDYISSFSTTDPYEINRSVGHLGIQDIKSKHCEAHHIVMLAQNNLGLYNMYRLISESHVHYFYKRPRIPRSLIAYFSSSIIVGAACERGEIYRYLLKTYKSLNKDYELTYKHLTSDDAFVELVKLYDYIEIQPLTNNMFMTREQSEVRLDATDIKKLNMLLVDLADYFKKPCCATTDAHFLEIDDGMYRKNLLISMEFADAENQADLYFRTTEEMLTEFSYLGEEKALEVVCTNTNAIADRIENGIKPFPDDSYPPLIATAASDVQNITWTRANKLYRHNGKLNERVKSRLEKELKSIIGNGYAIMYYIAYRLVKKSNNDGYIVGSRGSVGSSLVATMCGISEVNPLEPHYRCPECNYVEFNDSGDYGSGYDMPHKVCPNCGIEMTCDGQDIPFETFLGFYGDKAPDIDLNFSGEYQPHAHKYVEYLFGKTHTFRAGTIGKYADKYAYGIARKVAELKNITCTNAMLEYMSEGIVDVKRTTSQHPGGIVVIPKEQDIYEFTPIQYPANKESAGIITTHFDFSAMHDTILKLDILAHADPTVLRMLSTLTNIDVTTIPIPDEKVMSLLESTDALGFDISKTEAGSATLGLPELGTNMARSMIKESHPTHFYDLVQLMGLSHGTDVWTGNAQDLIREGICDLNSVIGCRDSIMTRLIYYGLSNKDSFDIMEKVRKGKGLSEAHEKLMRENNVPSWYIDSCKKIKYMFPKSHAAAYSISSLRVAWFKVYYPEEYYCAFYTIRGDEFNATWMCQGLERLIERRKYCLEQSHIDRSNPKIKSEFYLCELVEEMYARGISFLPIDIHKSDATKFIKVGKGQILPPLNVIESISSSMGESIVRARDESPFVNREDLLTRSKIGQAALQKLVDYGLLDDMPESSQLSLFDFI